MCIKVLAAVVCAGIVLPFASLAEGAPVNLGQMTLGYTYFNRPGADLKTHDIDVKDCSNEAAHTISSDEQYLLYGPYTLGLAGSEMEAFLAPAYHRGAAGAALESCMVVRGWRVVKLSDDEGHALAKLPSAELSERLAPWISAADPHGQVVRVWNNDATNSATLRFALRPDHTNNGQLSLIEATGADLHQFDQPGGLPARPAHAALDPKWPKKGLTPATLSSTPDGSAIIMVQVKGAHLTISASELLFPVNLKSPTNGTAVLLNREGLDNDTHPSRTDHAPDSLVAGKGASPTPTMYAFAVAPGRWRISGIGVGQVLNFCLGAPSFDAKAGEVVYAGSFDLGGADLGPDLDLAPAKAWLAGHPQAETVRVAAYANGSRGICGDSAIYALEVKGAPFEPTYAWGGAQRSALPTEAGPSAAH